MKDVEPGVVADDPVCHGLCGAQPAPSRLAAKRYVKLQTGGTMKTMLSAILVATVCWPRFAFASSESISTDQSSFEKATETCMLYLSGAQSDNTCKELF